MPFSAMLNGIFFAQALFTRCFVKNSALHPARRSFNQAHVIRRTILFSESPSDVFGFGSFLSLPYFDLMDAMSRQFQLGPEWRRISIIIREKFWKK
jgi:hypothetical protein